MKHSRESWLAVCLLAVVLAATSAAADAAKKSTGPTRISPAELAELIQLEKAPLILDVRSEKEYAEAHVPGAVNIPHDELGDRLSKIDAAKTDQIVVYCASGYRAGVAEKILIKAGYSNLRDLDGHMNAWKSGRYPTEQP